MTNEDSTFKIVVDTDINLKQHISGSFGNAQTTEEAEEKAKEYISKENLIKNLEAGLSGITKDDITFKNFKAEEIE